MLSTPAPPQLPSQFHAVMEFKYGGDKQQFAQPGHPPDYSGVFDFFFDNSSTELRQLVNTSAPFVSRAWTLYNPSNDSLRAFQDSAAGCRPLPISFTALFLVLDLSWVPRAAYAGTDGHGSNLFLYTDPRTFYNYSLAAAPNGTLLQLDVRYVGKLPGTNSSSFPAQRYAFASVTPGPAAVPADLFDIPIEGCYEKVPPCPDGKSVTTDVYLAHPQNFTYLDNEDTGDARGDVMFICSDIMQPGSAAFNLYNRVSRWTIEVLTSYGQYEECNGYPGTCYGLEDFYVGRQIPYGSATVPLAGQCTPNAESGSWFSHTAKGKCTGGQRPAEGVCSWRPVKKTKTIDLKCLSARSGAGMLEACTRDLLAAGGIWRPGTWIWNKSLPVFQNAFDSDDPASGGCPPLE